MVWGLGDLKKGLVLDMPLMTKYHNPGTDVLTDRTPYENVGANSGADVDTDHTSFPSSDTDFITINNDASLNFSTDGFTISVWVYSTGYINRGSSVNSILCKGSYSGAPVSYYILIINSDNLTRFSIIDDGYKVIGSNINNGWHHLVGLRNGNYIYFYIDTVEQGSIAVVGNTDDVTDLYLGRDGEATRYFNGDLSRLKIWNRTLSLAELELVYDKEKGLYS